MELSIINGTYRQNNKALLMQQQLQEQFAATARKFTVPWGSG